MRASHQRTWQREEQPPVPLGEVIDALGRLWRFVDHDPQRGYSFRRRPHPGDPIVEVKFQIPPFDHLTFQAGFTEGSRPLG